MRGIHQSCDAVSETVGYIIIVTTLFTFFSLVFAVAYPVYNSYVDSSHMQNMEKSFSILSYNANLVARQKLMASSTEIKMYGGVLAIRDTDALSLNVSYYNNTEGTKLIKTTHDIQLSALEYAKGVTRVAYIDGSVCKYDTNGVVMLKKPEALNGPDFLLIMVINLPESHVWIAGDTQVRIELKTPYYSDSPPPNPSGKAVPNVKNVTIQMGGDYAPCFSRYFQEELGFTDITGADGMIILNRTDEQGINLTTMVGSDVTIDVY